MLSKFVLALSALALSVAAVPLEGRNYKNDGIVWHTKTEVVVEVVDVYTTVWVKPPPKTVKVVATKTKTAGVPKSTSQPQVYHQHNHNKPKHSHKPKHSKKPAKAAPAPAQTYKAAPVPVPTYKAAPPPKAAPAPAPVYSAPAPPPAPKPKPVAQQAPAPKPTTQQAPPPPAPTTYKAPPPPPAPKTTQQAAPKPQPTYAAQPKPQAPSYPSSSSSSSGASLFKGYTNMLPGASHPFACAGGCKGDITYFNPSVGTGACGYTTGATDNDDVVAVSADMMGSLSSGDIMNPFCGKFVSITNPANGKTVTGKVTDKCPGCLASEDIDLSPALFKKLGAMGDGRIHGVKWEWVG